MLAMLLDAPGADAADLSSLRHVQYAASPISAELQRRVLERLPGLRRRPVLRDDRGGADRHPPHARGPPPRRRAARARSARRCRASRSTCAGRGRARRAVDPRAERHARLLEPPGRDRRGARRRLVPLRRHRRRRRARLPVPGRPREGHDRHAAARTSTRSRSRRRCCATRRSPRPPRSRVPDDRWGEAVHAVVVTREPITADALLDHCRAHIAGFKVPREIELRDEPLPKSGPGKVLKTQLREPFWEGRSRRVN